MSYSYDRTATDLSTGELEVRTAAKTDAQAVFEGFYTRKPPSDALDDLVKACRKALDEFLEHVEAEEKRGLELSGEPVNVDPRELHALIIKYISGKYGMERSLIKGFADQIVFGQNY